MGKTTKFLFAGFGGQGILFAGRLLAYCGLMEEKMISWLPSYGPEMRGGTANCSIIISDMEIGSPIVSKPDILVAMNLPSLDKYENDTVNSGMIFYDSSLINREVLRNTVKSFSIPATRLASENNLEGLANMVMLGKVIKESGITEYDIVKKAMQKVVSAKKQALFELNLKAIKLGYDFV